jgi:hypothetical protein
MIQDVTVCIFSNLTRPGKLVLSRSAHDLLREELQAEGHNIVEGDLLQVHGVKVEIRPDNAVFFIEQEKIR